VSNYVFLSIYSIEQFVFYSSSKLSIEEWFKC